MRGNPHPGSCRKSVPESHASFHRRVHHGGNQSPPVAEPAPLSLSRPPHRTACHEHQHPDHGSLGPDDSPRTTTLRPVCQLLPVCPQHSLVLEHFCGLSDSPTHLYPNLTSNTGLQGVRLRKPHFCIWILPKTVISVINFLKLRRQNEVQQ